MDETAENWQIRQATTEDIEAVLHIEQHCSPVPWQKASLQHDLTVHAVAAYWVAETASGKIVGYAACWKACQEADIVNMAVLPEWRRNGIASALLKRLLVQLAAEGVEQVFLDVRESNQAARNLYQNFGFSIAGHRCAYYADNSENAIIMTKKIGHNDK